MKCAICGQKVEGWGNNPYPIRTGEDDRCCNSCNSSYVIPARISFIGHEKEKCEYVANLLNNMNVQELDDLFKREKTNED